jgi:DNA-3-methyladenine glycosylase II
MSSSRMPRAQHEICVRGPYRLDLTVNVLRRLPANLVDVLTDQGDYFRAFATDQGPFVVSVQQRRSNALVVQVSGRNRNDSGSIANALAMIRRMLGVDRELSVFNRAAERISWLRSLARRMRGVKPPRYPSLWEAFVNAVVFQQLSLPAASAISRRLIMTLGEEVNWYGTTLYTFPNIERFQEASDSVLRALGLSASKAATLRRAAEAIRSGGVDEAALEALASQDAAKMLCRIKGIGPWTATIILLRGLGRLDVFPMNDSSVTRNLTLLAGSAPPRMSDVLSALGSQRGMLYYHLLLGRLDARGYI